MSKLLKNISVLSTSFLALQPLETEAQYYHDYDPDSVVHADNFTIIGSTINHWGKARVDIDGDGSAEFSFEVNRFAEVGSYPGSQFSSAKVIPQGENAVLRKWIPFGSSIAFDYCASVGPSLSPDHSFVNSSQTLFWHLSTSASAGETSTESGGWFSGLNKSLGIKVKIDSNFHYGWIRLSTSAWSYSKIILHSFYVNGIADSITIIGEFPSTHAPPISDWDFSKTIDGIGAEHFRIKFEVPDCMSESAISEYRVLVWESPPYDMAIDTLLAAPPTRYHSILPGSGVYDVVLPDSMLDLNGSALNLYTDYKIALLAIPTSGIPNSDQIRISPLTTLKQYIPLSNVIAEDVGNSLNASDIRLSFDMPPDESLVTNYRIGIIKTDDTATFEIDDILFTPHNQLVFPTGTDFDSNLYPGLKTIDGSVSGSSSIWMRAFL